MSQGFRVYGSIGRVRRTYPLRCRCRCCGRPIARYGVCARCAGFGAGVRKAKAGEVRA